MIYLSIINECSCKEEQIGGLGGKSKQVAAVFAGLEVSVSEDWVIGYSCLRWKDKAVLQIQIAMPAASRRFLKSD